MAGVSGVQPDSCEVCGRSILQGETTQTYISPDGDSHAVCELCRVRVEQAGWVRADRVAEATLAQHGRERRRRGRLGGLLSRRRNREGQEPEHEGTAEQEDVAEAEEPVEAADAGLESEAAVAGGSEAEPEQERHSRRGDSKPARGRRGGIRERLTGGGRDPRHVRAVPADPEAKIQQAMELFNDSEHSRTVAGVVRSLGLPSVSAGASAKTPSEVRLTVAWELSWYQWAVDLSEEGEPVRAIGHGAELDELDGPAREWNAHADEEGLLHPGLPER